ncbi:MAG: glycosyltransferase family A protein [Opitutaceae bacterium]
MIPELSVIIPYYNRADTIQLVLESVARARHDLAVEVILVDDGSAPSAAQSLAGQRWQPDQIIRQENQGLLFARLTGLKAATGTFVLFLDSDDLVGPQKFIAQLTAMRLAAADVSYTDTTTAELRSPYDVITISSAIEVAEPTKDSATFFIRVQPAPHSPIFRTAWLRALVLAPLFPPSTSYNAVAEIWFYHIAALFPAQVIKVPGAHTIIGQHGGPRLTNQWEKMGVASLGVMEAFDRSCPRTPATLPLRELFGEKAFHSWRALPYDFSPEFRRRSLALWRRSPRGSLSHLGGPRFCTCARLVGPALAGWVFRRLQGKSYQSCRTLADDDQVTRWLAALPSSP